MRDWRTDYRRERRGNSGSAAAGTPGSMRSPGAKMTIQSCPTRRLKAESFGLHADSHWTRTAPKKGHNPSWVSVSSTEGDARGDSAVGDQQAMDSPSSGGHGGLRPGGKDRGWPRSLHLPSTTGQRARGKEDSHNRHPGQQNSVTVDSNKMKRPCSVLP